VITDIWRALAVRWRWLSYSNPRLWGLLIAALLLSCLGDRAFVTGHAPGARDDREGA